VEGYIAQMICILVGYKVDRIYARGYSYPVMLPKLYISIYFIITKHYRVECIASYSPSPYAIIASLESSDSRCSGRCLSVRLCDICERSGSDGR
jgi:hypothetical protein